MLEGTVQILSFQICIFHLSLIHLFAATQGIGMWFEMLDYCSNNFEHVFG